MATLHGKVAIVTGASSGIGRALALTLARQGASVVVHYGSGAERAEAVVSGIRNAGGNARALQANLASVSDIEALFSNALKQFGRIDIIVNCAGISEFKPVALTTEEEFDTTFNLNTRGTFFMLREAAQHISDGGRIVNFSTAGTRVGSAAGAIYLGSKAAIEQFTKALAQELAERNVTVNTVSPGMTDTEGLKPMFREMGAQMSPFKRLGTAQDVADVVAFLVSEEARWITGQDIQAGGGVTMPS